MKIIEGQKNGFCFGVQTAVDTAERMLDKLHTIYTLGPIIHNRAEVDRLTALGAIVAQSPDDVPRDQTVVIRSHGVPPTIIHALMERGCHIADATCPFVRRIQHAVHAAHEKGMPVMIAGHKDHPEVVGINGYCDNQAIIVRSAREMKHRDIPSPLFLVAQTTFVPAEYGKIKQELMDRNNVFESLDSICQATVERQKEARMLSKECDAMVVVGGKHSSNTRKLWEICKENCKLSTIIEVSDDVSVENTPVNGIIGVVAGASTPQWLIREVITRMNEQDLNKPVAEEILDADASETVQEQPKTEETTETSDVAAQNDLVDGGKPETKDPEEASDQQETPSAAPEEDAEQEQPASDQAEAADAEAKTDDGDQEQASDQTQADDAAQKEDPNQPEQAEAAQEEKKSERELTPAETFKRDLEKSLVRIRPGQIKKGKVVQIVGEDVFVNIGYKSDGMIPQGELSLDPDVTAADLLAVGDEVSVEIIKVNDGEGNVLLSKKSVDKRNADRQAIADLEDGRYFESTVKQSVKSGVLTQYKGARVFIPASQLSDHYVEDLDEFVGKKLTLKALEVDKSRRRVVASHRQVLREQAAAARKEKYKQFEAGQTVKGIIRRITDFGAFTDIGGIDGLIHVSDLSWGRVKHPSDVVSVGDELEVQVLSVNVESERIALGYKQLQPKPWDHAAERYLVGDVVEGTVDRIAPFGAFVELEPGLFGLVHISQVATYRIDKVEDELRVGDVITVQVMDVNPERKRMSLSRRAVLQKDNPSNRSRNTSHNDGYTNRYEIPPVEEAKVTLGDLFPDEFKDS